MHSISLSRYEKKERTHVLHDHSSSHRSTIRKICSAGRAGSTLDTGRRAASSDIDIDHHHYSHFHYYYHPRTVLSHCPSRLLLWFGNWIGWHVSSRVRVSV